MMLSLLQPIVLLSKFTLRIIIKVTIVDSLLKTTFTIHSKWGLLVL